MYNDCSDKPRKLPCKMKKVIFYFLNGKNFDGEFEEIHNTRVVTRKPIKISTTKEKQKI